MKDLLREIKKLCDTNDDIKRKMDAFVRVQKTDDWQFFSLMLRSIQGLMANEMLSSTHTRKSLEEKDATQRSYYNTNQMIEFFLSPVQGIEKRRKSNKPKKDVEPSS